MIGPSGPRPRPSCSPRGGPCAVVSATGRKAVGASTEGPLDDRPIRQTPGKEVFEHGA